MYVFACIFNFYFLTNTYTYINYIRKIGSEVLVKERFLYVTRFTAHQEWFKIT